jgi:GAF domain-containing protein
MVLGQVVWPLAATTVTTPFTDGEPLDLTAAYSELQKLLLQSPDITEFMDHVAILASAITVPASSSGITLKRDGEVSTVAATSSLASQADEIQYGRGQGPCLHSLRTGEVVHVPDLAADDRWSDYRIYALTQGVRSSLSLPLFVGEQPVGALNIYTDVIHEFTPEEIERVRAFADQASFALTLVMRHSEQVILEDQLRNAIESRAVIDQALGIIMGQQRCTAAEAFNLLRKASQGRNVKLTVVAAELITSITGHQPQPPRPFTRR